MREGDLPTLRYKTARRLPQCPASDEGIQRLSWSFEPALTSNPRRRLQPLACAPVEALLGLGWHVSGLPGLLEVGYEIPFNRHFYVFKPPRPLDEIDADLTKCTGKILKMIKSLSAGGGSQ